MGQFRDYLMEARNKQVPIEFRIALGQLKRMYNAGEVPEKKELEKDVEMIAKKNHLDADKFLEFALAQFKINESAVNKFEKILDNISNDKTKKQAILLYNRLSKSEKDDFLEFISTNDDEYYIQIELGIDVNEAKKFILESAVGTPGRTTVKDAEEHINDELLAEFKKIIKKLGGKTVAKVLLDKLSQKVEIKDEIEHIEDLIDNSNY